jgi:hypothetical protein
MAESEYVIPNADIYIFDDDTNQTHRSDKVAEILNKQGILTGRIRSFHNGLKPAFDEGRINTNALFVMDCVIEEVAQSTVYFSDTLPFLVKYGVDFEKIVPASSAFGGYENNENAIRWLEKKSGHARNDGQTGLMEGINSMDPLNAAERILDYYEYLKQSRGEGNGLLR